MRRKGRRERGGRGGALGSCGGLCGGSSYMLALVVGLLIASLLTQLTNCQSLACTTHKIIEYGSVRKRDGQEFFRANASVWDDKSFHANASVQSTPKTLASTPLQDFRLARTFRKSERSMSRLLMHLSQRKYNRFTLDK